MGTESDEQRPAALAGGVVNLLQRALPSDAALRVRVGAAAGGREEGEIGGSADDGVRGRPSFVARDPHALGRSLWPPTPAGFAEAYVRGDIEIEGDAATAIGEGRELDLSRLSWAERRRLLRWGLELRSRAPSPRPVGRRARLRGRRHSRARDLAAVRFHYDVGNDFFAQWLDRRLTYSCAYFAEEHTARGEVEDHLDAAQEAKLDLICRKLALREGQRLLDIGCGWGSLLLYAASRYGVDAVGVTLSQPQAEWADEVATAQGLEGRVSALVRDYRDLGSLGRFDAVASVGMFEHVGRANLGRYFRAAWDAVQPGGFFLNHGIATTAGSSRRSGARPTSGGDFIQRFVFPDGELVAVEEAIAAARSAGFEVVDVQSLRPHYALTLRAWVRRLERAGHAAVDAAGEEVVRTWRLYMAASQVVFERGEADVFQLLLARPGTGRPAPRPLRPWW